MLSNPLSTPRRRGACARLHRVIVTGLALLVATAPAAAGELAVTSVSPAANGLTSPVTSVIQVQFDRAVDPASVDAASVRAFGRWSGPVGGPLALSAGDTVVTLTPDAPFSAGEMVTVTLSHDLRAADGSALRAAGYSWQFWTAAAAAPDATYDEIANMTTEAFPRESSRAYGGIGTDLNNDGYLDLTIVNEDTADLRVFMNLADGTGQYAPFMQPTFPVGQRASPSEPADFNNDGNADICVANIDVDSVSILLGAGNGMFLPQQMIVVGDAPRGIAVLDVDGDGDTDIVNTNFGNSNLSLLLNNGSGVFGLPTFFQGDVFGEWSLTAADMNEDGILDLVVGGQSSANPDLLNVLRCNGDGTFTPLTPQSSGGNTWMLAPGDVNGDGHIDISSINSGHNNGAFLMGDGAGGFAAPVTYFVPSFPLATDLGDIDGDGDLDWVSSSFNGNWRLHLNDGAGNFSFDQEFVAPLAASCALLLDIDNDLDLDLALVDELEDRVIILRNSGPVVPGDLDGDGLVNINDLLLLLAAWGPCPGCAADLDGSGTVDINDLLLLLANWS